MLSNKAIFISSVFALFFCLFVFIVLVFFGFRILQILLINILIESLLLKATDDRSLLTHTRHCTPPSHCYIRHIVLYLLSCLLCNVTLPPSNFILLHTVYDNKTV